MKQQTYHLMGFVHPLRTRCGLRWLTIDCNHTYHPVTINHIVVGLGDVRKATCLRCLSINRYSPRKKGSPR
jgi:hypothetical protein